MMTCRLLCALLVFALCCCPSVCAAEITNKAENPGGDSDQNKNNGVGTNQEAELSNESPPSPTTKVLEEDTKLAENKVPHTSQTTGKVNETPQSQSNVNNTEKADGKSSKEETENANTDATNGQNQEAEYPPKKTTTTTTRAPTTTTTTTKAPSNTTTEAPTTTTTRAPSHPREIDGSLRSSAWVCAPLLLAVSALAYTTLG
ncbi:mucin TcMUCII, putative [Trypanosoma cruzi marinkellei]|uniref:Mucin TcMUCII, putative n=1 Tax=Trypanosoma cruzi marinkellei TaxID=85056 RepID=K2NEE0_TRYCR|nr:mucin TcMUCII, putative [Trypanosoma cruzi marinkellei]